MSLSIGAIDPKAFIYRWSIPSAGIRGLVSNVLVANSPQAILSTIYYTYNGLFTCFLLGFEWNSYASKRKGLRISSGSRGAQRMTYFLQLPYRWALPLMVLSGTLHWLCSQALFLVSIQFDNSAIKGPLDTGYGTVEFLTCGYSPLAILSVILVGLAMVTFAVVMGRKKHTQNGIPVAGSCSASISACCHLTGAEKAQSDEKEEETALLPLQWGDTGYLSNFATLQYPDDQRPVTTSGYSEDGRVGHCSFSSHQVGIPAEDVLYAGIEARLRFKPGQHV
jgi:hypothetical protein